MKKCTKCFFEKSFEDFNFKNKAINIRQSYCNACQKIYSNAHYKSNKTYYKNKARKNGLLYATKARDYIASYLSSNPCVDCSIADIRVLQFDHVRDIKEFDVALAVGGSISFDRLVKEIEKCDVRCANCHQIVTAQRLGSWRSLLPL